MRRYVPILLQKSFCSQNFFWLYTRLSCKERAKSGREQMQQTARLLDHLVGAQQKLLRDRKPDRLRGLEVDRQYELGRQLDRKVARLLGPQNAVDIGCRALPLLLGVRA